MVNIKTFQWTTAPSHLLQNRWIKDNSTAHHHLLTILGFEARPKLSQRIF